MQNVFQSDYCRRGRRWAGYADVPDLPSGAVVLETGCGNGKTLHALLSSGKQAFGIDISEEAVRLSGSLNAAAGDVCHLPFRDESFDAVFSRHVLGHLSEARRKTAAGELIRVTKRGGAIYFSGFGKADFRFGRGDEVEPGTFLRGDGIMTHYFTEGEVKGYFSDGCSSCSVSVKEWELRVRGSVYPRCEIEGFFIR